MSTVESTLRRYRVPGTAYSITPWSMSREFRLRQGADEATSRRMWRRATSCLGLDLGRNVGSNPLPTTSVHSLSVDQE